MLYILIATNYGHDHIGFPGASSIDKLEKNFLKMFISKILLRLKTLQNIRDI